MTYTGSFFSTKRSAKEDACRFLLLAQQRVGRLLVLLPFIGQEAEAQQASRGGAQQAGPEGPRPQVRVQIAKAPPQGAKAPPAVAKAPPPEAAYAPPGLQQGLPPPTPAEGQDPGAGLLLQGENTEALAGGSGRTRPFEARPAPGDLDPDVLGNLTARFFLSETTPPLPLAQLGQPRNRGVEDFLGSDSSTPTERSRSGEEDWVVSAEFREQEAETRAAWLALNPAALQWLTPPCRQRCAACTPHFWTRSMSLCQRKRWRSCRPRAKLEQRSGSEAWSPSPPGSRPPPRIPPSF